MLENNILEHLSVQPSQPVSLQHGSDCSFTDYMQDEITGLLGFVEHMFSNTRFTPSLERFSSLEWLVGTDTFRENQGLGPGWVDT